MIQGRQGNAGVGDDQVEVGAGDERQGHGGQNEEFLTYLHYRDLTCEEAERCVCRTHAMKS